MDDDKFFSETDICFHLNALKKLAMADGVFDDSEKRFIDQITQKYCLSYTNLDFESLQNRELTDEADSIGEEVRKGWLACGIRFGGRDEENYYEDMNTKRSMTQESAMRLAMQRMGKQLAWSDWYWD